MKNLKNCKDVSDIVVRYNDDVAKDVKGFLDVQVGDVVAAFDEYSRNFVSFADVEKPIKYRCKYCGCVFCGESEEDMDEDLWGHIQINHENKFKEVQDWETPYMVEECYKKEN